MKSEDKLNAATPGPWVYVRDESSRSKGYYVKSLDNRAITGWGRVLQNEADAALIASAPRLKRDRKALLAACKDTLIDLRVARLLSEKGFGPTIEKLQAAIKQAEEE